MKNIIKYFFITCIFFSCSDKHFDKYPEDELTEGVFYKNSNDFELAINDAYNALRSTYNMFFAMGDIASDDAYNWKNNNSFDLISINESNVSNDNGVLNAHWNSSYTTIARANIVLDKISNVEFDGSLKTRIIGEAKFLRSLAYFDLVRVFGDIPMVTTVIKNADEAFGYGRSDQSDIYGLIIEDLITAEENLPVRYEDNENIGRATRNAAKSLLGKVYLTLGNYENAIAKFKEVVDSDEAILLDNYHDVFDSGNANNREIIFAVQYARNMNPSQGSAFGNRVAPNEPVGRDIVTAGSGFGQFHITDDLMNAFTEGDERLFMIDSATGISQRQYFFTQKYNDPFMVKSADASNDWIILRYSDVLLMLAESLNIVGNSEEAIFYLNQVRSRAGVIEIEKGIHDKASLDRIILNERRIELHCEGHRWFDLVRKNIAREVMNRHFNDYSYDEMQVGINSSIEEHELIFPIPHGQVLLNPDKIHQNPGY